MNYIGLDQACPPSAAENLAKYSTPGLRRNVLTRREKRDHLADVYKLKGKEAEKLLDQIYSLVDSDRDGVVGS